MFQTKVLSQRLFICTYRYEVELPPDGQWGIPLDNGSWNGGIGLLQRKVMKT